MDPEVKFYMARCTKIEQSHWSWKSQRHWSRGKRQNLPPGSMPRHWSWQSGNYWRYREVSSTDLLSNLVRRRSRKINWVLSNQINDSYVAKNSLTLTSTSTLTKSSHVKMTVIFSFPLLSKKTRKSFFGRSRSRRKGMFQLRFYDNLAT